MVRKFVAALFFFIVISTAALAQFYPTQYRPPHQNWQYVETPHFKLLFSKGNDSTALQMGRILEEQYSLAQNLVGGELNQFPVILNDYNDRSNGFVTTLHFRSEIELPPIKGKTMNPRTGNWLENVGPHELVHALQMSNLGDYNIPQLVNLFSPDLARSFHGAIPSGVTEGLAVHHETKSITEGGGRGNYPYFTKQFDATFKSNQRWSMGQLVHISSDTRPLNRHYIGGYEFTSWLQGEFGRSISSKALDFYMDYPFLGYGVALRHVTGLWPSELYDRFEKKHEELLKKKGSSNPPIIKPDIPFKGRDIRRPKWLSDSTLIFYGSFYNARSGFYRYNLNGENMNRLITTNSIGDYRYDLSGDRSTMVFGYYESNALYDNTYKAELVRYNFDTGEKQQITRNGRLYAPVFYGNKLMALQTAPASSRLVTVDVSDSVSVTQIRSLGDHEIKAAVPSPAGNTIAVIANKRGLQGLWLVDRGNLPTALGGVPDISFEEGSVFDPEWHPGGDILMFSSDFSGTLQLYEFHIDKGQIKQITNTPFNAFEGSYSPGGDRVAFIRQEKNEKLPAIIDRTNFVNKSVSSRRWRADQSKKKFIKRPVVADSIITQSKDWKPTKYSTGISWLKPRTILPVFEEIGSWDVYQMGFSLHSNNLLGTQAYSAQMSYAQERGWYNITYRNKSFYPGFKARFFSRPSYINLQSQNSGESITFLRQERSLALSIPLQYQINQNIFSTSFYIEPEFRQSQLRFFDLRTENTKSDFANLSIANLYGQLNYRLQQNIRDIQPNTGIYLYGEIEHYLSSGVASFSNSRITFNEPSALRGGIYGFISPFRRWNQSLRLGLQGITQTNAIFDNQSIVSDGFSERILPQARNLISFSTRYTIPLAYIDDGGFLFPLYLSNIYLVGFSNTVTDPAISGWREKSRTVFGLGIRSRFRLSNMTFDIGVGYGYEPSRGNHQFFMGDF